MDTYRRVKALYYLIYYADWAECEGNFSVFGMDIENLKGKDTVEEMIKSSDMFETERKVFYKLDGELRWPFEFTEEEVRNRTPLEMGNALNRTLSGCRILNFVETDFDGNDP